MSKASRQRAKDVRKAHRQGFSYSGFKYIAAGGDTALAERTAKGLKSQAEKELKTSYAPLNEELSRRDSKIKALDEKRAGDEKAFAAWMTTEQGKIRATAEANNATLIEQMRGQAAELKGRQDQRAAAGVGMQGVAPAEGVAKDANVQGQSRTEALLAAGNTNLAATQSNSLAFLAQKTATRQADTLEKLAENADLRTKSLLQQAADGQKRIAELLQGEVQKAQVRIASKQFNTKELNDAIESAAGRRTTERGQDSTADTADKNRAQDERDRAAADRKEARAFRERHGISYQTWDSFPQSKKDRWIREGRNGFGAKGREGNGNDPRIGASPKQIGTATNTINQTSAALRTGGGEPMKSGGTKYNGNFKNDLRPLKKGGRPNAIAQWMINNGAPPAVARIAVFLAIFGRNAKLSRNLKKELAKYAAGLPN